MTEHTLGSFENLLLEHAAGVATITVNRPKVLNALNAATLDELRRAILALKHDEGQDRQIQAYAHEKRDCIPARISHETRAATCLCHVQKRLVLSRPLLMGMKPYPSSTLRQAAP